MESIKNCGTCSGPKLYDTDQPTSHVPTLLYSAFACMEKNQHFLLKNKDKLKIFLKTQEDLKHMSSSPVSEVMVTKK